MAAIGFVSRACLDDFEAVWGPLGRRRAVVHNGLAMAEWHPAPERERTVLLVGRAAPEKGVLPAVEALASVLARRPGWRAVLVLNALARHPDYVAAIRAIVERHPDRFELLDDRPFAEVKALTERAAIALVPSQWREPFGRTALEALAGGACLISSGTGGLAEIGEGVSMPVDPTDVGSLAAAVETAIVDAGTRLDLARRGRARAEALFDIGRVSARLDDLYEAVLA